MTGPYVAGVDGGGTRTRVLVLARDGATAARAEGPAALVRPDRPAPAARVVADTVRRAAEAARAALPLPAVWAGLAGAGRVSVRRALEAALRKERIARAVRVGTDVEAAFHDAFGAGPGIVVVAGTGSVVLGAAEDGRRLQVGGWGGVMGDEGSGYHIGVSALRAVAAATDRRGPPTALTAAMLDSLGLDRPRHLPAWAESATKADIAALAPLAIHTARSGDAPATAVVRRALDALGDQLSAALRELVPSPSAHPSTVALAGGLISPDGPLRADAERLVASAGGHLLPRAVIPERGAARLALTLLD
ncbi:MAG: N-acetylglucosamine kinase [Gammaproteobacteria bacterium]|nr:N-acetylglucosamine kinase [Gammaproteobacteria bacterium]